MAQTSAATVVYAVHTWGGRAFPGLLLHEFLRKVDLAAWFLFSCVAKTSLFFSLTVWVFCKQKQLICQQGRVLRSWVRWDRGTASTPQSCRAAPRAASTRVGTGEEHTESIKGDSSAYQADL